MIPKVCALCFQPFRFLAMTGSAQEAGSAQSRFVKCRSRGAVEDSFPLNGIELLLKRSPEYEQAAAALADVFSANGVWSHFYIACDSDPATGALCVGAPLIGLWREIPRSRHPSWRVYRFW